MNEEIFETVLNEILDELRKSNKSLDSLIKSTEKLSAKEDIETVKKEIGTAREEVAGSREDISNLRKDIGKLQGNIIDICKDTQQLITALEAYRKAIPLPPNLRPIIRQFRITLFGSILLVAIATIIFFATPYRLYQAQQPPIQHQDLALPLQPTTKPPTTINNQQPPPHHHLSGHKKNNSDTLHKKNIYEIADSLLKSKP
jgi:polyhydroxyalkanoate synthesis regulator phasin